MMNVTKVDLASAPIVEVSARTGEGFEGFYEAFSAMVMAVPGLDSAGRKPQVSVGGVRPRHG